MQVIKVDAEEFGENLDHGQPAGASPTHYESDQKRAPRIPALILSDIEQN